MQLRKCGKSTCALIGKYESSFIRGAINGVATYRGVFNKTANVYLSKSAFISKPQLYMTMHHEYMHAYFYTHNVPVVDGGHNIIHNWHFDQLKAWGPAFVQSMYQNRSWYSPVKTYSQFGFKIINWFPW